MVALGLIGVVWQSVSQRTSELGLRRALGASTARIYWQISGELLVITSLGLALGVFLVAQFPLLDVLPFVSPRVYLYGLVLSVLLVYALTIACCVYPSRLATKIMPAEALHWE
jgi:putative ABC transport system permease protein